jgi:hypothetical protein
VIPPLPLGHKKKEPVPLSQLAHPGMG